MGAINIVLKEMAFHLLIVISIHKFQKKNPIENRGAESVSLALSFDSGSYSHFREGCNFILM